MTYIPTRSVCVLFSGANLPILSLYTRGEVVGGGQVCVSLGPESVKKKKKRKKKKMRRVNK